jgi:hypothetical protein
MTLVGVTMALLKGVAFPRPSPWGSWLLGGRTQRCLIRAVKGESIKTQSIKTHIFRSDDGSATVHDLAFIKVHEWAHDWN